MTENKNEKNIKEDMNEVLNDEIKESISDNNEVKEENKNLDYKTKIYNKLTCSNFVKNLSFIFIVAILLLIITFMIPNLMHLPGTNSYLEEERIFNEQYVNENVESTVVIEELDEEYVLIKNTISNKGEANLEIIKNVICIEKLICGDKCKYNSYDSEDCSCSTEYITLYDYDSTGRESIVIKSNKTRVIEYKVPKKFANTNEYIIKNYMYSMTY